MISELFRKIDLLIVRFKALFDKPKAPRAGWDDEFKRMARNGDDKLLMPDTLENDFDKHNWVW